MDPWCDDKKVCSSTLLSQRLPAGLWLYLTWRIVRSGRRGRGLAWVRHALSMAGRQFRVHLVRLGFGAKVCRDSLPCFIPGVSHRYELHSSNDAQ